MTTLKKVSIACAFATGISFVAVPAKAVVGDGESKGCHVQPEKVGQCAKNTEGTYTCFKQDNDQDCTST